MILTIACPVCGRQITQSSALVDTQTGTLYCSLACAERRRSDFLRSIDDHLAQIAEEALLNHITGKED